MNNSSILGKCSDIFKNLDLEEQERPKKLNPRKGGRTLIDHPITEGRIYLELRNSLEENAGE